MVYGNNETRSAKTTLNSALRQERRLNIGESTIGSKTFNSQNFGIDCVGSHDQTRTNGFAVDDNGATATFTLLACSLCTWEAETLSQDVQQTFTNPCIFHFMNETIHA
jgi:hypothetical protein